MDWTVCDQFNYLKGFSLLEDPRCNIQQGKTGKEGVIASIIIKLPYDDERDETTKEELAKGGGVTE